MDSYIRRNQSANMSVKYIRLNGDALRQIVENEKHCFRIAMNKQDISGGEMTEAGFLLDAQDAEEERKVIKPPYEKGDILALKETWAMIGDKYVYRLDRDPPQGYLLFNWKPSVQMPNDAARHFIRIIDVRVERLQDISLNDIEREGIWLPGVLSPELAFASKWNSGVSEKKRAKIGWEQNPFVWVFDFDRCVYVEDDNGEQK